MTNPREESRHVREARRSRSPARHGHRHGDKHRQRSRSPVRHATILPLGARPLSKHDLKDYIALFGLYLDLQKQLDIDELSEVEVKGRWKSFIGKWYGSRVLVPYCEGCD